jgi:hypothetical protein
MQKDPSLAHSLHRLHSGQRTRAPPLQQGHRLGQGVRPPQGAPVLWPGAAGGPLGHQHDRAQPTSSLATCSSPAGSAGLCWTRWFSEPNAGRRAADSVRLGEA